MCDGTEKKYCFGLPWEPSQGLLCVSRGDELSGAENMPLPSISLTWRKTGRELGECRLKSPVQESSPPFGEAEQTFSWRGVLR